MCGPCDVQVNTKFDVLSRPLQRVPRALYLAVLLVLAAKVPSVAAGFCPPDDCQIRPGAQLLNGCTLGWVLLDEQNVFYVTTAAHCTALGGRLALDGLGDFATVTTWVGEGVGRDYAVARVDDAWSTIVRPDMSHFGAAIAPSPGPVPSGIYQYYGWGEETAASDETRARFGAEILPPIDFFAFQGRVSAGDSGAPVRSAAGLAIGIVTHRLEVNAGAAQVSGGAGTPLATILSSAAREGQELRLFVGSSCQDKAPPHASPPICL